MNNILYYAKLAGYKEGRPTIATQLAKDLGFEYKSIHGYNNRGRRLLNNPDARTINTEILYKLCELFRVRGISIKIQSLWLPITEHTETEK